MTTVDTDKATPRRLGIMGGGQLGMFLCQSARRLGLASVVHEASPAGSALPYADETIVAGLDDPAAIQRLIEASDVVTFELEAIPDESLEQLRAAEAEGKITVHPSIDTLSRFKDKGVQKRWLQAEGLPTLPALTVEHGAIPGELLDGRWPLPVVQKAHRGGYDGKGVQLLRARDDLDRLWDVPSYLEPALDPCRELSVVVARDAAGELAAFPPVSMTFDPRYNAVFSVSSPALAPDTLVREADRIAREAVARLDTPGVFAVELFVDPDDHVTINEISPRVHNSGHLTIEAFQHSQFDQHVRAVMGLPLAPIVPRAPAAEMFNLLYDEGFRSACPSRPGSSERGNAVVHWYGKSTGQAGRKMGHITATGPDAVAVQAAAERAYLELFEPGRRPAVLPHQD
ncbi:MAG: ATP-grasp domain-containing protein [Xanthomonadales bacterium]|jgi:5-(carboxyamino)imidazole ribonucleotide synthase|nr:ATP-grasp domain-containing protein [Xanthomonadales bacterium]